jgi:hypothetical protein
MARATAADRTPAVRAKRDDVLAEWLPLLLLLAVAAAYLYCPAVTASNLSTVPDAVEYATAARRLAVLGRYDIPIGHSAYPPRYPPGFPALVLAPVYRLFPDDLGNGVYAVWCCGLICVGAAWAIGRRIGGPWGGVLAGLAVLGTPEMRHSSRDIMSDVPALALGLITLALWMRVCDRWRWSDLALAGVSIGAAYTMRVVYLAMWLPFAAAAVRRGKEGLPGLAALSFPVALAVAAIGVYNAHTFGQWSRTGYSYWCAVPYDYLWLTFSPAYIRANLASLATTRVAMSAAAGLAGALLLRSREPAALRRLAIFLALGAGPVEVAQLLYFAPGVRFHFLALAGLAILAGGAAGRCVPARFHRHAWAPAALALPLAVWIAGRPDPPSLRRVAAEAIAASTPRNAVIVTAIDAVFLDPYLMPGSDRIIVPVARDVEYASKLITPRRISPLEPPPRSAIDHRAVALLRGGAIDPFPYTAEESPERIAEWIRQGRPVYVDHSFTAARGFWSRPNPAFIEEPVEGLPWLRRLRLVGR